MGDTTAGAVPAEGEAVPCSADSALEGENKELKVFLEDALKAVEQLKSENAELQRQTEDALLDRQVSKALTETEKVRQASEAYNKELLQQKLNDREVEISRLRDQLHEAQAENTTLATKLDRVAAEYRTFRNTSSAISAASGDGSEANGVTLSSARDREELAGKLVSGGPLDTQVLAAAAKALLGGAVLEQHLQHAIQEKERFQQEVQELNETVFSKAFKAPSAWADRERKYKMEKHDWEQKVEKLKAQMAVVRAENERYRKDNKAAEFEARIANLKGALAQCEAEKLEVAKELHELKIEMRGNQGTFTTDGGALQRTPYSSPFRHSASGREVQGHGLALDDPDVHDIVDALESRGIGPQQPRGGTPRAQRARGPGVLADYATLRQRGSFKDQRHGDNFEEIHAGLEAQHIGALGPAPARPTADVAHVADGAAADVKHDANGEPILGAAALPTIISDLEAHGAGTVPAGPAGGQSAAAAGVARHSGPADAVYGVEGQPVVGAADMQGVLSGLESQGMRPGMPGQQPAGSTSGRATEASGVQADAVYGADGQPVVGAAGMQGVIGSLEAQGVRPGAPGQQQQQGGAGVSGVHGAGMSADVVYGADGQLIVGAAGMQDVIGSLNAQGVYIQHPGQQQSSATASGIHGAGVVPDVVHGADGQPVIGTANRQGLISSLNAQGVAPQQPGMAGSSAAVSGIHGAGIVPDVVYGADGQPVVGAAGMQGIISGLEAQQMWPGVPDQQQGGASASSGQAAAGVQDLLYDANGQPISSSSGAAGNLAAVSTAAAAAAALPAARRRQMFGEYDAPLTDEQARELAAAADMRSASLALSLAETEDEEFFPDGGALGRTITSGSGRVHPAGFVVGIPEEFRRLSLEQQQEYLAHREAAHAAAVASTAGAEQAAEPAAGGIAAAASAGREQTPAAGISGAQLPNSAAQPAEAAAAGQLPVDGHSSVSASAGELQTPTSARGLGPPSSSEEAGVHSGSSGLQQLQPSGRELPDSSAAQTADAGTSGQQHVEAHEHAAASLSGRAAESVGDTNYYSAAEALSGSTAERAGTVEASRPTAALAAAADRGADSAASISSPAAVDADAGMAAEGEEEASTSGPLANTRSSTRDSTEQAALTLRALSLHEAGSNRAGRDGSGSPGARSVSSLHEALGDLERDKAKLDRMYGASVEKEDVGALQWKTAELESRGEMYVAQLGKLQRALERADEDKASLESELATALQAQQAGDVSTLDSMRERFKTVIGRYRKATPNETASERLTELEAELQNAYREQHNLKKRTQFLERQLTNLSALLGPAAAAALENSDVQSGSGDSPSSVRSFHMGRAASAGGLGPQAAANAAIASVSVGTTPRPPDSARSRSHLLGMDNLAGLSDEDMEVIKLREENGLMMESLVRVKLELAETQSDWVKAKRALIRSVEKQVEMSNRIDVLEAELELGHKPDYEHSRLDTQVSENTQAILEKTHVGSSAELTPPPRRWTPMAMFSSALSPAPSGATAAAEAAAAATTPPPVDAAAEGKAPPKTARTAAEIRALSMIYDEEPPELHSESLVYGRPTYDSDESFHVESLVLDKEAGGLRSHNLAHGANYDTDELDPFEEGTEDDSPVRIPPDAAT